MASSGASTSLWTERAESVVYRILVGDRLLQSESQRVSAFALILEESERRLSYLPDRFRRYRIDLHECRGMLCNSYPLMLFYFVNEHEGQVWIFFARHAHGRPVEER